MWPRRSALSVLCLLTVVSLNPNLVAADMPMSAGQNLKEMSFQPLPGFPTCAAGTVQSGDPGSGPSIIAGKMDAGCTIPWHWHTPAENVILVSGEARMEMKDGEAAALHPGAFSRMPSGHVHQFTCTSACVLYVYSDAPFDIHYVDAAGAEISPVDALKKAGETAFLPSK